MLYKGILLWLVFLLFVIGCQNDTIKTKSVEITEAEAKQVEDLKQLNKELNTQLDDLKLAYSKLERKINDKEKGYEKFTIADQHGRKFYQAMIHGNIETLKEMVTSDIQVYSDYLGNNLSNGNTVKVPFKSIQTEEFKSNNVIMSTNGFDYDDEENTLNIYYAIMHPERNRSQLNIELVEESKNNWRIKFVIFDI